MANNGAIAKANSIGTESVTNITFGTLATLIGLVVIWQGQMSWKNRRGQANEGKSPSAEAEIIPHQ